MPAGGRLVYNTGRALDLFEQLLKVRSEWWRVLLGWAGDACQGCTAVYLERGPAAPQHMAWRVCLLHSCPYWCLKDLPLAAVLHTCHLCLTNPPCPPVRPCPLGRTRATCCRSQTCSSPPSAPASTPSEGAACGSESRGRLLGQPCLPWLLAAAVPVVAPRAWCCCRAPLAPPAVRHTTSSCATPPHHFSANPGAAVGGSRTRATRRSWGGAGS